MHSRVLGLQLLKAIRDDGLQVRSHGLSCSGDSSTNVDLRLPLLGAQLETPPSVRTSTIFDPQPLKFAFGVRKNPKELVVMGLCDDWVVQDLGLLVTIVNPCRDCRLIYHLYVPQ